MKITLNSPEELEVAAKNLFYVLRRYGEAVDQFHAIHGHAAKDTMHYWRNKAIECMKDPAKIHFTENINIEYEEQGRSGNE